MEQFRYQSGYRFFRKRLRQHGGVVLSNTLVSTAVVFSLQILSKNKNTNRRHDGPMLSIKMLSKTRQHLRAMLGRELLQRSSKRLAGVPRKNGDIILCPPFQAQDQSVFQYLEPTANLLKSNTKTVEKKRCYTFKYRRRQLFLDASRPVLAYMC